MKRRRRLVLDASLGVVILVLGVYVVLVVANFLNGAPRKSAGDIVIFMAGEQRLFAVLFLIALVVLVSFAVFVRREFRRLVERATIDPLTKLPNRSEFEHRANKLISTAAKTGEPLAIMVVDLDRFKIVNDTYGHQSGDQLLVVVAERLRSAVRADEMVARWGGDEFTILLPGLGSPEVANRRVEEVVAAVCGLVEVEAVRTALQIRVSAGVAIVPIHATDLEGLIKAADASMYIAKRNHLPGQVGPQSESYNAPL